MIAKFMARTKAMSARDSEQMKGQKSREGDDYDAFANSFNPKYLTSRDLFKLEVRKIATIRPAL